MLQEIINSLFPLFCYILVACAVYVFYESRLPKGKSKYKFKSIISYCFPGQFYLTKSASIDLFFSLLNGLVLVPIIYTVWGYILYRLQFDNQAAAMGNALSYAQINFTWLNFAVAATIMILADGVAAYQHYLAHRIPFLWEFHKVHHSAPVLNLMTSDRHHPVSVVIGTVLNQVSIFVLILAFQFLLGDKLNIIMVWAIGGLMAIFLRSVDLIKHTHVWVSWGKFGYILQSPAMHQAHHSDDPRYHHKNFGGFFSFWDWSMGTLYLPEKNMDITYGLKQSVWRGNRYDTFWGSLWDPFKKKVKKETA